MVLNQRGFSTVEILIAFAIVVLALTAVIGVVAVSQSTAVDSQTNQEAQTLAQKLLENARALSRIDFESLNSSTSTETLGNLTYNESTHVTDISQCAKQVNGVVSWWESQQRPQQVTLATTFTNIAAAIGLGGNCDPFPPSSDWDTPVSFAGLSASSFHGQGTGVAVSNIEGRRYAFLTTDSANPVQENFFVIDTTDFDENDPNSIDPVDDIFGMRLGNVGLNGVVTALNLTDDKTYAYVLQNSNTGQIQILDVSTDPTSPSLVASTTLPGITNGFARSIFYYDEKIYVGTQYVPCPSCAPEKNNEFHVYDVSDPSDPNWPVWQASIDVDRNVNDIFVNEEKAYLAIGPGSFSPYTPLKIFNLNTLSETGAFQIGDQLQGTSVYLLGNNLYLGLERTTKEENFYVLDISANPPQKLASVSLEENNSEVGDIVVQSGLAFVGLEGGNSQNNFQVWNVSDLDNIWRVNPKKCNDTFPQNLSGLIYRDNLIFASFRSNEAFKIIYDTPDICT